MVEATENPTLIDWPLLSDVFRHFVDREKKPEVDIRSEILEAMCSGKLPHLVERTIRYLPRPAGASTSPMKEYPAGAPTPEPPPMEVTHNKPIPPEVLA